MGYDSTTVADCDTLLGMYRTGGGRRRGRSDGRCRRLEMVTVQERLAPGPVPWGSF